MALSDDLTKLASRAKEAEDHAAAARRKARADLEADVKSARAEYAVLDADLARREADELAGKAGATTGSEKS